MKRSLCLAALTCFCRVAAFAQVPSASTAAAVAVSSAPPPSAVPVFGPKVALSYPREGANLPFLRSSFVLGSVFPSSAAVAVNGSTVSVYRTGSFAAVIPFQPGPFNIRAVAAIGGASVETLRTVTVAAPAPSAPASPATILKETVQPLFPVQCVADDPFVFRFRGSPGLKASYRLIEAGKAVSDWQPMAERASAPGLYEADWTAPRAAKAREVAVEYRLGAGAKAAKVRSAAAVQVFPGPAILKAGPASGSEQMGYDLFLPKGTKLRVSGRNGNELRVRLSAVESGWTEERNLKPLPPAAVPARSILDGVSARNRENGGVVSLDLREKVPYRALLSSDLKTLSITLYYTVSNLDRIRFPEAAGLPWLDQVRWFQETQDTVRLDLELNEKCWGYDLRYEGGRLACDVFLFPREIGRFSLKGLTVAVDPGHSPDLADGAIGPQGIKEDAVCYQMAGILKDRLEKEGARVFVTRASSEAVALPERGKRAFEARSHLFISLHANALPDGADPMQRGGHSVFFFQPQSADLARAIQAGYRKLGRVADDGLYYGNLAVCRIPQMPSVLVESGYLIRPDEEELLLSLEYQRQCADAVADGVLQFVQRWREGLR